MATLDQLYRQLYEKVTEDDLASQQYYLSVVADHRKIAVDYLLDIGMLFIPNNEYIRYYLGEQALTSMAGLYFDGKCPWTLFAVIPIRSLSGEVMGLVGWDAYNKYRELSEGEQGLVSYRVSPKSVFSREKYFLSDIDCLKSNFDSRVLFVTDGVFDALSLSYRGIPAIALLGSSFSREVLYFLSWYKAVYICTDNDSAGVSLYKKLHRASSNVYRLTQNRTKDIEELLRSDGVDGPITNQFRELLNAPTHFDRALVVQ